MTGSNSRLVEVQLCELDPSYLRFLYPEIEIDVLAPIVYVKSERNAFGFDLTLRESKSGIPMYQKSGVIAFLREMQYMQESKIARLENSELQTMNEVYGSVAMLRVANHVVKSPEDSVGFVTDFLMKPLDQRVMYVMSNGTPELLHGVLTTVNKVLDKELLKFQHKCYQQKLREVEALFKKKDFKKDYELSSEWLDDLVLIQYYFRDV